MAVSRAFEPVVSRQLYIFAHPLFSLLRFRDYYAALLRTHQSFVAPTQGKLLNYVLRVPLGVVAQITVRPPFGEGNMEFSYYST